ncbi:hypothetical protein J132_00672, partial [Termitomyces sp. J132]
NLSLAMISRTGIIAGLAASIQNPTVQQMQDDLPATGSQFSWSLSAFILVHGLMPLVWMVYILSLALFMVGSIVVAVGRKVGLVIGFRCLQAAGSSAVISIDAATLADMYEPAERGAHYWQPMMFPEECSITDSLLGGHFSDHKLARLKAADGNVSYPEEI